MASLKAGTYHMHAADDVTGLDEAVSAVIEDALPEILLEAEVVFEPNNTSAYLFEGQVIPAGLYAANLSKEKVEQTGSWTTVPSVSTRLSAGASSSSSIGAFVLSASQAGSSPGSPSFGISLTGGSALVYVPEDRTIGATSRDLIFLLSVNIVQTGCTVTARASLKMRKLI